jgi:MerR family mercuric resistance operon transcriptional regulator
MQQYLSIGTLSRQSGVGVSAIRYYGEVGLLPAAATSEGGHRLYTQAQLRRLMFIRRSRELGFGQKEVRQLLGHADRQNAPCNEVARLAQGHLNEIRSKIDDLRVLERALAAMTGACPGDSIAECSIIDALYRRAPR